MPEAACLILHCLTSVKINSDDGLSAALCFVVEGLCDADLHVIFEKIGEALHIVLLNGFVGKISAAFVRLFELLLYGVLADVEARFAAEAFDDLHLVLPTAVERDLFAVAVNAEVDGEALHFIQGAGFADFPVGRIQHLVAEYAVDFFGVLCTGEIKGERFRLFVVENHDDQCRDQRRSNGEQANRNDDQGFFLILQKAHFETQMVYILTEQDKIKMVIL